MPAVLDKPAPAEAYAAEVDEQLAQATSRIRAHDLAFGGILLAAMLLVYATAMILLDKFAVLPEWVRQVALLGFLASAAATAYWMIVRPLRQRVNPLYAAVQVEKTIDDAKNSVAGYVEAQDNCAVHPAVKAAMGARAAKSVGEADVNQAVDHRSLIYTGAVAIAFLLALVVLFFVFRPAQFQSLAARTFAPFSADPIKSRTQLALVEPAAGDVTITAGQSITVKVQVGGKVPSPDKPDRIRVMLRHNPASAEYEELPLEKGDNSREWQVRVPDYLVRNGFWYKVAGGDAETPEYKVAVRSLPHFTDYDVAYEFPAYVRRKPETTTDAHLRAIRGTKITLIGKTNRTVKDGKLAFDPPARDPIIGKMVPEKPEAIQFQFYLTTSCNYRMYFTSSEGERSPEPMPFTIVVDEDLPPRIEIQKPEDEEITVAANGQLAVDAAITDDLGIDKATLKMRLVQPAPRGIADKPFQDGKSYRRTEKDGTFTWPTSLAYKDSVDFTQLKDDAGQPVELKEGMVIEYWVEAADNRTKPGAASAEPDPNIGKSQFKRVRVGPPVVAPEDKKNLDAKKNQRQKDERKNNDTQQQRLDTEPREPNVPPNPPMGMPEPKTDMNPPMGMMMPEMGPKMGDPPMPKEGTPPPMGKMPPEGTPMPKEGMPPMMPPGGMNDMNPPPNMAPMPSSAEDKQAREDANRVQQELDKQKQGGSAKAGPTDEGDRTPPSDPKPMPMGSMPPESKPKEPPKSNDPMMGGASDSKSAGTPQKPEDPSAPKPEPMNPMNPMGGPPPADAKAPPKNEPMTKPAGSEKPTPQPMAMPPMPLPEPDKPNMTEDKSGGGGGKPATQQKPEPGMTGMDPMNPAPDAAKPKPMPSSDPGAEKPSTPPMGGSPPPDMGKPENSAGGAKPDKSPPASDAKPAPKDANPMTDGASQPKPTPGMGDPMMGKPGPSENKPDGAKPPMGGAPEKGIDKPSPDQKPTPGAGGSGGKPDPEKQKEFEDAVKDLASKDPAKQKAAQDKLDKMVGTQNRKDIEQNLKDFEKNVNDLKSPDGQTKKDAQDKLDKTIGQQNRKDIEQIQNGLDSKDPKEKAAAEQKLKELQAKAGAGDKDPKPKGGNDTDPKQKIDPKYVEQAMKDLQSDDKATRDAAKEKLDKAFGKGAGDKAEQLQNDLKSTDPDKRAAAQKEIDDMKKKKDGTPGAGGKKPDPKEVERALDDLNSDDKKTRDAAKQKLDDMLGKGAGDKAEQINKDARSGDFEKEAQARKDRDDLIKKAEQMAKKDGKGPKGKELSKEELEQLAKDLKNLNDPDDAKRKAAEQNLDKQIGEQARKQLQEAAKDPKKAEELKNKLDELAKQGGANVDEDGQIGPRTGDPTVPVREAMKEDARNRAKSAELQLEQFEKNKNNKDLLERLDMTPEQYERFLMNYKREVANLKKEADDLEKDAAKPTGPATTNVSGARKIDSRGKESGPGSSGGIGLPAPGYAEAIEKFQKGVSKTVQPKK